MLADGKAITLEKGNTIWLTTDYDHVGTPEMVGISYKHIARDVQVGYKILMADGAILLEVRA